MIYINFNINCDGYDTEFWNNDAIIMEGYKGINNDKDKLYYAINKVKTTRPDYVLRYLYFWASLILENKLYAGEEVYEFIKQAYSYCDGKEFSDIILTLFYTCT